MYHLFFVYIWLINSIFGEFSNIYLLSAQNRVKWRHKIRPITKKIRPILIFFARDDATLMPGEVCQVSCRYSNKWRSYSRKTEGGSDPIPPRRWRVNVLVTSLHTISDPKVAIVCEAIKGKLLNGNAYKTPVGRKMTSSTRWLSRVFNISWFWPPKFQKHLFFNE